MQFLLSRYAMPAAASTEKRTSCFVFSSSFFFLRKDRKSPPDETQREEEDEEEGEESNNFTIHICMLHVPPHFPTSDFFFQGAFLGFFFAFRFFRKHFFGPPTWNQLHDDVDGLPLRTHANELHNVWVVVLFQDPTDRRTDRQSEAAGNCTCCCQFVDNRWPLTWPLTGT